MCAPAWAANYHICSGGTGDGSTWTACAPVPAGDAWNRANTYYIATGDYSGRIRFESASGAGTLTVKKATAGDHGSDTGWSAGYGTGQAVFTYGDDALSVLWVNIGSLTITGQYRSTTTTGHGFKFYHSYAGANDHQTIQFEPEVAIANVTISYIDAYTNASATGVNNVAKIQATTQDQINNVTLSYSYFHDASQDILLLRDLDSFVLDNSVIARNLVVGETHGQGISNDCCNNVTISNNIFEDITSSGQIASGMSTSCTSDNWKIYNNIFYRTAAGPTQAGGIRNWSGYGTRTGWYIVGNTFYQIDYTCSTCQPIIEFPAGSSGNYAYNNIMYQLGNGTTLGISNITNDYNAYYGNSGRPNEAHKVDLAGDPFVTAGSNFHLTASIGTGKTDVGIPFNVDKDGVARSQWIGAYEYQATPETGSIHGITSMGVSRQ